MAFKLTIKVPDSLTIGHILTIEGIELLQIDQIPDYISGKPKMVNKPKVTASEQTDGNYMSASDRAYEFLEMHGASRWADIKAHVMKNGYATSTVNGALYKLRDDGKVKNDGTGKWEILSPNKKYDRFHHPSGSSAKDLAYEFIIKNQMARLYEVKDYLQSLGFAKGGVNKVVQQLSMEEKIKRISNGIWVAVAPRTTQETTQEITQETAQEIEEHHQEQPE